MALEHDDLVRAKIDNILKAGIITPVSAAWSFPVEIAMKEDGKPRIFCRLSSSELKNKSR